MVIVQNLYSCISWASGDYPIKKCFSNTFDCNGMRFQPTYVIHLFAQLNATFLGDVLILSVFSINKKIKINSTNEKLNSFDFKTTIEEIRQRKLLANRFRSTWRGFAWLFSGWLKLTLSSTGKIHKTQSELNVRKIVEIEIKSNIFMNSNKLIVESMAKSEKSQLSWNFDF